MIILGLLVGSGVVINKAERVLAAYCRIVIVLKERVIHILDDKSDSNRI